MKSKLGESSPLLQHLIPTFSVGCRRFKNGKVDGPVVALHPGNRVHWFHMLEEPRWEDYEWRCFGRNTFSYLGHGFSVREGKGRGGIRLIMLMILIRGMSVFGISCVTRLGV